MSLLPRPRPTDFVPIRPSAVALTALLTLAGSASAQEPVLEPHRFDATFESGSVGSWASYPPAQDTAYDPTIWVRPLARDRDAPNRALYREITPHYRGDREFGLRELLDLYVDGSSVIAFRAYVDAVNGTDGVKIRMGFGDGSDLTAMVEFDETRRWVDARIDLAELIGSAPKKALTAVAFMAVCPDADPGAVLRLGLDSVSITGWRPRQWTLGSPRVHRLDEQQIFVAGDHFDPASTMTIQARSPVAATSARVSLRRALTGEDSESFPMTGSGRDWQLGLDLNQGAGLGSGLWRATLEATTPEGAVSSDLAFLVRSPDAPSGHPRLFMSPGDENRILARAATGHLRDVWQDIQDRARAGREMHDPAGFVYNLDAYDAVHWLPTLGGYREAIGTPARYIRDNAVVYALSGDPEAGDSARRALIAMAEWPTYVHPHILDQGQFTYWPAGLALIDYALGFDMVYDRFTDAERRTVAAALFENGVMPVAREYVRDDRVSSNTSNWISHVTGGGILSALAILGDVPDAQLEPHLTGLILKLGQLIDRTYEPDGAYGEGYAYANFTMQTLGEIMPVLERNFGVRFPETIAQSHRTILYQLNAERRRLDDFGDTETHFPEGRPSFTNYAYALGKWRDPYLKWLYDRWPGATDRDLFFADLGVEPRAPSDLPTSALFRKVGTAVFRSGFSTDDFAFTFRAGPFFNHQHFDQGSFLLSDRGEELVVEVGRSDYYNDPWYQPLVIQAGGHSTILVDDDPESQKAGDLLDDVPAWQDWANLTDFTTWEGGGFVSGRLERLYKGATEFLARSALWVAPRTIVLIDRVTGAADSKTVNLRFHALRKQDIQVGGDEARIARPDATLFMRSLSPNASWNVQSRPMTLYEFNAEEAATMTARGFLQLDAPLGLQPTTLVTAMSTDGASMEALAEIRADDHIVVTLDGTQYAINTGVEGTMAVGLVATDATVYADTPGQWLALQASTVVEDGRPVLTAARPVSLAMGRDGTIRFSTTEPTDVTIRLRAEPTELLSVDESDERDQPDEPMSGWTYSEAVGLSLTLPAGQGTIRLQGLPSAPTGMGF